MRSFVFCPLACLLVSLPIGLHCSVLHATNRSATEQAKELLSATSVQGGLVVHVGSGDGQLLVSLARNGGFLGLGLDPDPTNVAQARSLVESLGLYGRLSVDLLEEDRLPLIDNLVNLLIVEPEIAIPKEELLRVLAPQGVLCSQNEDGWSTTVKPTPPEYDDWPHYLHDATNNAVSQDTVVAPPRRYQWIGSPKYLRHHDHMSGLSAMVSTAGRIFYIIDLGPRWSVQMPPQWTLIARDAFNGTILWQKPIPKWHAHLWPLKKGPAQLMRRLVAIDDRVYVTPAVGAPIIALDAATGKLLQSFKGTEGTEEVILQDGTLYALAHPEGDAYKSLPGETVETTRGSGRDWHWDEKPRHLIALDPKTGKILWKKTLPVAPTTMACAAGRVYIHDGNAVLSLDASNGQEIWTSDPLPRWKPMHVLFGPTLVVHDNVVLFAGGENMDPIRGGTDTMTALSADSGKTLWTAPHPPSGYASSEDLFVINGLVWCGVTTNKRDTGVFTGRDLHTGEVKVEFPPDDWPHMPHHRCHRAKATCNYILTSRTGIEYIDLESQHWTPHHWVRGSCNYGIMPANGLTYAPPHSCACYPLAKLTSLNALAPARTESSGKAEHGKQKADQPPRLQKGPAYQAPLSTLRSPLSDWPTLRANAARSGSTTTSVPTQLGTHWRTQLGGRLSAPVVAEGRLFVASIDTHDVHAINATSGKLAWTFKAGARVDSPPTIWRGRALFGSADGRVYCLRAEDGALVWQFQAAPHDLRMTAYEQLESVWPVHGSVLVRDGIVYCISGRAMWLDGGLRMLRLDAESGRMLSETVLDDTDPETGKNLQHEITWPNLPVALPDVLSCDDKNVYMRSQPFDLEGNRREITTPRKYEQQRGDTSHLFCPTGFLDDAWWHRSYWIWGQSFIGGAGGWYLAAYQAPAGRLLVTDDKTIYGFGRVPNRFIGTPNTYHLFACGKTPKLIGPKQPPRKQGSSIFGNRIPTRPVYDWSESVPFMARSMVLTDDALFAAGPPVVIDETEVYLRYGDSEVQAKMRRQVEAFEGQHGSILMAAAKQNGEKLSAYNLQSSPVFDGMAAANGMLYLSMLDGSVLCLGANGQPLTPAPEVEPGPPADGVLASKRKRIVLTETHPDFQHLVGIAVTDSELGYRMSTAPKEVGLAMKKLDTPIRRRAEFRLRTNLWPGVGIPDKPGNGFLTFGDGPDDAQTVKCGFRVSGKRIFLVQGPLEAGTSKSAPADVKSDEVAEIHVVVDLEEQTVSMTMKGETLTAELERPLDAITWVGCSLTSVTTDFSPVEVSGE
jgi:outer membrane protein assembly factor BamB